MISLGIRAADKVLLYTMYFDIVLLTKKIERQCITVDNINVFISRLNIANLTEGRYSRET